LSAVHDLVVRSAAVIDGTGAPRYRADVAVQDGRIAEVGLDVGRGRVELDGRGKVIAPGFIDTHAHDDRLLLSGGDMAPKVSQGVTTVIVGNCGVSLAPAPRGVPRPVPPPLDALDVEGGWYRFKTFREYVQALEQQPPATNYALLVGHSSLRVQAMDDLEKEASEQERSRMRELVTEALDAGALGVSTGLYYEPARAATTEEVIEVCRPLNRRGGLYCTHLRDEGDRIVDAMTEAFTIGRALGVRVVLSHHKLIGRPNHGRSEETLALIDRTSAQQPVCLDCYPYDASSTTLKPDRAKAASRVLVTWSKPHPEAAGKDLAALCAERQWTIDEAILHLSPGGAIYFAMDEEDVRRILAHDRTMIGSDGGPHEPAPHPRLWGTFPRVLGHYARDVGLFPLETAVHKMTGLPARNFGLRDRGIVAPGMAADLALFDPEAIAEGATFEDPIRAAAGISAVVVNGRVAWQQGEATGERPGRLVRRSASA
jgi:N-acyl-D-amino-acid deacylase